MEGVEYGEMRWRAREKQVKTGGKSRGKQRIWVRERWQEGERKFEWSVCQFADKRGGASDNNASCIFNAPQASVAA